MKSERLNTWLSLIANFGLVVGLVLLIVEINQNTEMMRAQISHSRSETAQSEGQAIFNSEYMPRILAKVDSGEELSSEERIRFQAFFRTLHRNQDNVLWQYNQGFLDENIPNSVRAAARGAFRSGRLTVELWDQTKLAYTEEYVSLVEEVIVDLR